MLEPKCDVVKGQSMQERQAFQDCVRLPFIGECAANWERGRIARVDQTPEGRRRAGSVQNHASRGDVGIPKSMCPAIEGMGCKRESHLKEPPRDRNFLKPSTKAISCWSDVFNRNRTLLQSFDRAVRSLRILE